MKVKEFKSYPTNGYDNLYLTLEEKETEIIFEKEKWLNSNERLFVKIFKNGLAHYGLEMQNDPVHGGKYTWSSRSEVINEHLLFNTPYKLIRSDIGVRYANSYSCYGSYGVTINTIMPLIIKHQDKLHFGIDKFKEREIKY